MTNPLIGRTVRFEGRYRGIEGIVLGLQSEGREINLLIECTKHPMLPTEIDGARAILTVTINPREDGLFYALPPDTSLDDLKRAAKEMLASLDSWRDAKWQHGPETASARHRVWAARTQLETILGLPITHRRPPEAAHRPRMDSELRLIGCTCGFECTAEDQLAEHMAVVEAVRK